MITLYFVLAPVLQNFHVEFGAEGGFAPAQLAQAETSRFIISEEFIQIRLISDTL